MVDILAIGAACSSGADAGLSTQTREEAGKVADEVLIALADEGPRDPPSGLGKAIERINDKVELYKPERGG